MDVVTAYLYGPLDNDIYMKVPEGFKLPEAANSNSREHYCIKLNRSLYRLKQSGRMWYNRLTRFSSCPTRRHWNGIKHVLRYLQGTKDMGLFFSNQPKEDLIGFADAGYLSDPHNARSQTGYVFTSGGTAISWRSMKQTIAATLPTMQRF
ncbi:secreted RxLR effector protein 161-like [Beta vulgaris subsp. vulgaris]|uniref:secreted RxLR effector protein 161-like n=1 Tax=Beta vulgaris subsp. vulgaris TaxID=3555 RepID=UPI002546EB9C|nr:secreted RxLR effector protein 161-like [Beta vulgaris subsp. vulgaris]